MKPQIVAAQEEKLLQLIEQDNAPCIRPQDVADLLGIDIDCLRSIAEKGCIPFAICGRSGINGSRTMKIPKLAIWNWFYQNRG